MEHRENLIQYIFTAYSVILLPPLVCCVFLSTLPTHHCDAENILRSAAVAHSLSHPAELGCHVGQPLDRLVGVMLDNGQDLIILLFGDIQQLGYFIQLHMQFTNTGALCGEMKT